MESQKALPNVKQAVPFFMVKDIATSLDFYQTQLGFEMKNSWEGNGKLNWCWLSLEGASIMLQEYSLESLRAENRNEGVSIYFICEDALAIYKAAVANGLHPQEPFVGNNMWVVGLTDPDGYQLFFESATNVPEETTYTEWASEGLDD